MADFVSRWAGYDNGNPETWRYDLPNVAIRWPILPYRPAWRTPNFRLIGRSTMSYTAPVKDMLFVLKELAGIDAVAQ
ncbi:acyl-CoA dehydrogenase N-terminal domain-containing protein, partial [Burkholderia ubonensis]|uniref:acyl-CoA dehydrogenase N-terminal domain-containing protein n=1 Tax=Burkholderia ubonensis TaxID=101571 RepID=UPI001E2A6EE1